MEVFGEDIEEWTEGWVRVKVEELGQHVGQWVLVDPHPQWYDKADAPHQGELLRLRTKDYKTGKWVDFVYDGSWRPIFVTATLSGYGIKDEVRELLPIDPAYVYRGDLEYPEPYHRVAIQEYSRKGFTGLELTAAYWQAVALKDEQLAELLYRFSTTKGI